ncbi:protein of unknown function (plasmid) [Paraburkholderia dioscoreae]|uniref:Uncharacterized protein n=2 Tax=Paraburkholderia dioscoreae TaxID=2604047 RepID=A0A5Q4ZQZ3_9BURK|nr:protein of unknown function [Paraburkholderia dioscoreae]
MDNIMGYGQGTGYAASVIYSMSVTAGIDQNGAQGCTTACSFAAVVLGIDRSLELDSNYGPISLGAYWGYSD